MLQYHHCNPQATKANTMTQAEFDRQVNQEAHRLADLGAAMWEARQLQEEAEARRVEWEQIERQNSYLRACGQQGMGW